MNSKKIATSPDLTRFLEEQGISTLVLRKVGIISIQELSERITTLLTQALKEEKFQESSSLEAWLTKLLNFDGHSLHPDGPPVISESDIQLFKKLLIRLLNILLTQFEQRTDLLKLTFRAIDLWQRNFHQVHGLHSPISLDVRITVPEPNPYAKEDDADYFSLSYLLWAFERKIIPKLNWRLPLSAGGLTPEEQFGGFLFFVITQSGITQKKRIQQIATLALSQRLVDDPYTSFLLLKNEKKHPLKAYDRSQLQLHTEIVYRWIPDPISKSIFERHRQNWQNCALNPHDYFRYIQQFLTRLPKLCENNKTKTYLKELPNVHAHVDRLNNLTRLLAASRSYQRKTLPAFIWHYLEGNIQTSDLKTSAIERLLDFKYHPNPKGIKQVPYPAIKSTTDEDSPQTIDAQLPFVWCNDLILIVDQHQSGHETRQAIEHLNQSLEVSDFPLIKLISHWVISCIQSHPSIKALQNFATVFVPLLILQYNLEEDLVDFDHAERIEELEELISENSLDPTQEKYVREGWHDLNLYLLETQKISSDDYFPQRSKNSPGVDTEYISEVEFLRIQSHLLNSSGIEIPLLNQYLMILTLAYRFGLRRSEVCKLAVSHVSYENNAPSTLSLRWWSKRRLKSSSSKRNLPIKGILSDQEFACLHLLSLARRQGISLEISIFDLSMDELTLELNKLQQTKTPTLDELNEELLFFHEAVHLDSAINKAMDCIHASMRKVVHPKVRFHHLRHSTSMNLLILLLAPYLMNSLRLLTDIFFGNPDHSFSMSETDKQENFLAKSRAVRQTLLNQNTSSSEIYAVSRLLGHSSPRTTFASYMHLLPSLCGFFLHERFCSYSKNFIESFFAAHKRTTSRVQMKNKVDSSFIHSQKKGRKAKSKLEKQP